MKLRRWQLIWTLLNALWLGGWAAPIVILRLRGDTEQLSIYFSLWVAVVLIPTIIVYTVGLLFGAFARKVNRIWLFGSIGWVLLVSMLCVTARGPINPFDRLATPLAAAIALLIMVLPPLLLYTVASTIGRFRKAN